MNHDQDFRYALWLFKKEALDAARSELQLAATEAVTVVRKLLHKGSTEQVLSGANIANGKVRVFDLFFEADTPSCRFTIHLSVAKHAKHTISSKEHHRLKPTGVWYLVNRRVEIC